MPKIVKNKKVLQVLKKPAALMAAILFVFYMSLNLHATASQSEGRNLLAQAGVEWEMASAFEGVTTFSTSEPHWAGEDQILPMGQNYVDLFLRLDWGDATPFPINHKILTVYFSPPEALSLASAHRAEGTPGNVIIGEPVIIPITPPRQAQYVQLAMMGGPLGEGFLGEVGLHVRLNIESGTLVNAGDYIEVGLLRAALPGHPAISTSLTLTRAAQTFDILYRENAQQGGTVGNMPADQTGLLPGSHPVRPEMPTHTNLPRDGESTAVRFVGWSNAPVERIFGAGERDELPAGWINPRLADASVTITDADVPLYAIWGWSTDGDYPPDVLRDTFSIYYRGNAQSGGTVSNLPATRIHLLPGNHTLSPGAPSHSPVLRDDVYTRVVFQGWSLTPYPYIFNGLEPTPALVTTVTITNANISVYAVWGWSTCEECNECPGCDECFDCGNVEECDCGSGYCTDCCDCCDCDFICPGCDECCDVEECDCGSGYCTDCCDECAPGGGGDGERGPAGAAGPAGPVGQPGRAVPKTGDGTNMNLWISLFALGLLGFAVASTKLVINKAGEKIPLIVVRDENNKEHFISQK